MGFKSRARLVFVDTQMLEVHADEKLDIVLSPRHYWVKRQTLPVKYLRDVKKLLPSLFEDTLEAGKYSYTAYKEGDEYLLFAYQDKEILERLSRCGIEAQQINKVYFAQSEFSHLEGCVRFEKNALGVQNGVVIQLPSQFACEGSDIDLETHELSNESIVLARYSHIADDTSMKKFMIFMGVLIALFVSEWAIVESKISSIELNKEQVFEKEGLKVSNIQNQAILTRLNKRYQRQTSIRQLSGMVMDIKLLEGERLVRLELVKNTIIAEFSLTQKKRINALNMMLKKSHHNIKKSFSKGIARFEVAL